MSPPASGVASLEYVEAIIHNDAIYDLAALIPPSERGQGGRSRRYPDYMLLVYEALISVHRSARRVEVEIGHPLVWDLMRKAIRKRFAKRPDRWLPVEPMRRHHYLYGRERILLPIREQLRDALEQVSAWQAVDELGLCHPDGPGSATHPDLSRMLYADGKVVAPLWRAKAGDTRLDKRTGELKPLRYENDAALHITGSGEPAWGTKHVMVATRHSHVHGRMILSVAPVTAVGREADAALACIERLSPQLPGALGLIYDGALRGVHLLELLRERGLLPIVPVQAKTGGRRRGKPRVERTVLVGQTTAQSPGGVRQHVVLYARAGTLCIGELNTEGDVVLTPLERLKIEPRRNADLTWRWYGLYRLPETHGSGTIRVRLDTTDEDRARGFNRCEHLRPIPPSDPEYPALYHRRSDAESINRALDDSSWLGRAHSVGRERQLLNLIGYAIAVNSLTLHRHRRRIAEPGQLAA